MKINSISNNNYQKQQSFGAIPGSSLKGGLKTALQLTSTPQELVTFLREEKKLAAQVPPQDFASRFREIKVIGQNGEEIDPIVNVNSNAGSVANVNTFFDVRLPNQDGSLGSIIKKTAEESPRTFVDKFLSLIQKVAERLQKPEDVKKAADAGTDAFLNQL